MQLDATLQISFGISATLIAIVALWVAWHTARGKPVHIRVARTIDR
jgi:hypothetical protein